MADTVLTVDGYDLALLGFQVSELSGWRDGLSATWPTEEVPGRYGPLVTGATAKYKPRTVTVKGAIVADTMSAMLDNLDNLKAKLGLTEKTYTFVDAATREFVARPTRFRTTGIAPHMTQRGSLVAITLWLPDPRLWASSPTVVGSITTSDVDLPMGTAPVRGSVAVTGSGTFTLTYKDSSAVSQGTMTITGATAPVTIDMDAQTIVDAGGNAVDKLTAGNFFEFDPEHGDYATSDWPTLTVSAGTATATYTKAYL